MESVVTFLQDVVPQVAVIFSLMLAAVSLWIPNNRLISISMLSCSQYKSEGIIIFTTKVVNMEKYIDFFDTICSTPIRK